MQDHYEKQYLKHIIQLVESFFNAARNTTDHSVLETIDKITGPVVDILCDLEHTNATFFDMAIALREYIEAKLAHTHEASTDQIKEREAIIKAWLDNALAHYVPEETQEEKDVLDLESLPILEEMVAQPDDSPKILVKLAKKLDELVKAGRVSSTVAAKELSYALDRPQIKQASWLRAAIEAVEAIDHPGEYKTGDASVAWDKFMSAIQKASTNYH